MRDGAMTFEFRQVRSCPLAVRAPDPRLTVLEDPPVYRAEMDLGVLFTVRQMVAVEFRADVVAGCYGLEFLGFVFAREMFLETPSVGEGHGAVRDGTGELVGGFTLFREGFGCLVFCFSRLCGSSFFCRNWWH